MEYEKREEGGKWREETGEENEGKTRKSLLLPPVGKI